MKFFYIIFLSCIVFADTYAQDTSVFKDEFRNTVIEIAKLEGNYTPNNLWITVKGDFLRDHCSNYYAVPDTIRGIAEEEAKKIVRENFSADESIEEICRIYSKHYKLSDVKALLNFYKSPIGVKYLANNFRIRDEILHYDFAEGSLFQDKFEKIVIDRLKSENIGDTTGNFTY